MLKEIYTGMTEEQRQRLLANIVNDGMSLSAAYAWCKGKRRPKRLYQERICKHLARITGKRYELKALFPDKTASNA